MDIDSKIELTYRIEAKDLAKSLSLDPQDDFPEVLATSKMIALMELAASRLIKPILSKDELSVGVNVNVNHLAATPNGETVKVVAIFRGMEGKLFKFDVEMQDKGGKVGSGSHTRARVNTDRLLTGAMNRLERSDHEKHLS